MINSKPNTNREKKALHPPTKDGSKRDSLSFFTFSEYSNELEEGIPLERKLSRTSMLILDYKQFKAARTIQAMVRGWMARSRYMLQRCAAIIIQREWRRYFAQRNYYNILEQKVQDAIDTYHRSAAIRIQAYWRGFLVREHIHDQYRMKRSQRMAVEDLMNCIALKLHYLLRTYQIPGIYSLRNSHALSKVEKLLISISFKQGNKRSFYAGLQREADSKETRKEYQKSAFGTKIPYAGPNFSGICQEKCSPIFKEANIDARMHQILRKYESEEFKQQLKCRSKPKKQSKYEKYKKPKNPTDFCSDVINSMRRWNILAPNKFCVRPDVFKNAENVAEFLTEIESMYDFMYDTGKCCVAPSTLAAEVHK